MAARTLCNKVFGLFCFLSFQVPFSSQAQGGREFWFAPPEVASLHADRPIYLRVSTFEKAAVLTLSQPANPAFEEIVQSIPANSLFTFDLSDKINLLETKPADQVLNTGLYIKASQDVSVYYEVAGTSARREVDNTDIFVLKGNQALGTKFFIPMQTYWDNQTALDAWASFDIVAVEDGTVITISPTKPLFGHVSTIPFSVSLNKGQTYSARAASVLAKDRPSGTKVEANKSVAITYKDDSMYENTFNGPWGNYDLMGDQLVPVQVIGTEYIAVRSSIVADGYRNDKVFFTAIQDSTLIVSNTDTLVLQTGETKYHALLDSLRYFKSNKPVYALHVASFQDELGGCVLPSLRCTGSKKTAFVRSTYETFVLTVLVKAGGEGNFSLNGNKTLLSASAFKEVPGSNAEWKYAEVDYTNELLPETTCLLVNSSSDFHLGLRNGGDETGFRYGYFSGYGSVNLGPDKLICLGDSAVIDAGLGKDAYLWNTSEITASIAVKDTGFYSVTVTKDVCEFKDTLHVSFYPSNTQPILGNDTASCLHSGFTIVPKSAFSAYKWQDNNTSPSYAPRTTGQYVLQVTDTNGCRKTDSLFFTSWPLPQPKIVQQTSDELFCESDQAILKVEPAYSKRKWFTGDTTEMVSTTRTADDVYGVEVANEYGCKAKTSIMVDCTPYLSIPNVFTPNGDQVNDRFRIKNLREGDWELEIVGRWGEKVYHSDAYQNEWAADNVPDGLYFYFLKHKTTNIKHKGWVQVLR
jgi:gliding motility-associated-like protein